MRARSGARAGSQNLGDRNSCGFAGGTRAAIDRVHATLSPRCNVFSREHVVHERLHARTHAALSRAQRVCPSSSRTMEHDDARFDDLQRDARRRKRTRRAPRERGATSAALRDRCIRAHGGEDARASRLPHRRRELEPVKRRPRLPRIKRSIISMRGHRVIDGRASAMKDPNSR